MSNLPTEFIGQTFEDVLVIALPGQEYIGCKFLRCEVHVANGCKFYDCEFIDCTIVIPKESEDSENALEP